MQALAANINARGQRKDTVYFYCKQGSSGTGNVNAIPLSNTGYAAIPSTDNLPLQDISGMSSVDIIAVGQSTLKPAVALSALVTDNPSSPAVKLNYITHMIEDNDDLKTVTDHNITVFTPSTRADIAALDKKMAARINLVQLDSVPHTNSKTSCKIDYDIYMNSPSGHSVARIVDKGEPFAFVVLNAGFSVDGNHVPYAAKEAREHGAALGRGLPAGTHLILAHGGPRNLLDQQDGHDTMNAFATAYQSAQAERNTHPQVICERYESGLPYNIIKAGYLLSQAKNCMAFISNSEGYGTMDGAALHVNNKEKLLGMFPFQALYADTSGQRQENIEKYNRMGVSVLGVKEGRLVIKKHPQQKTTPHSGEDAASRIVRILHLTKELSTPPKAHPKLQA